MITQEAQCQFKLCDALTSACSYIPTIVWKAFELIDVPSIHVLHLVVVYVSLDRRCIAKVEPRCFERSELDLLHAWVVNLEQCSKRRQQVGSRCWTLVIRRSVEARKQ